MAPSIYFIIPAYNEEKNLPLLVKNTTEAMASSGYTYKIYIVNDGSTDGTSEVCRRLSAEVPLEEIRLSGNRGAGEAFNAGFRKVFGEIKDNDIIVTKEADNTSDPDILKKMINLVAAGYDVVLASCFAKGGGVENSSLDRHVLSFGANTLIKLSFPMKGINTYSSFYRAFNARRLSSAFSAYNGNLLTEKGFVSMVEMLVKLSRLRMKMVEVPMVLRCDRREGVSKMRRRKTIAGYLRFITKQFLRPRKEDKDIYARFLKLAE